MKRSKILVLFVCVLLTLTVNLNAFMAGNESCTAFSGSQCDTGGRGTGTPTIGWLIAEGGGYFLESNSHMLLFLSKFEFSEITGPDFKALQESLDAAIDSMEKAQKTYFQLKDVAALTPYNPEVTLQLIEFDYARFQEENELVPVIFEKVKKYLITGDVRGVYSEFYSGTGQILETLTTLKKDIDAGVLPKLSSLWRINQKFSEVKLFAQYVAEVFFSTK